MNQYFRLALVTLSYAACQELPLVVVAFINAEPAQERSLNVYLHQFTGHCGFRQEKPWQSQHGSRPATFDSIGQTNNISIQFSKPLNLNA